MSMLHRFRDIIPYLARWAIYFLALISSYFFKWRQIISGSTGPIFAILAPNNRYLLEYDRSGRLFLLLMATN